jgi:hypothetical protein
MAEFDHIISLGGNCSVARAIRDYFGVERASPFDWWLCHIEVLSNVLNSNFYKMFEYDEMQIVDEGTSVISNRYWARYHHDFERDENDRILPDIKRQLPGVREKYAFMINRMTRLLNGSKVLFVRHSSDQALEDSPDTIYPKGVQLLDATRARWPTADVTLICLYTEQVVPGLCSLPDRRGLIWDSLGPDTGEMWRTEQYYSLFRRHDLHLTRSSSE